MELLFAQDEESTLGAFTEHSIPDNACPACTKRMLKADDLATGKRRTAIPRPKPFRAPVHQLAVNSCPPIFFRDEADLSPSCAALSTPPLQRQVG